MGIAKRLYARRHYGGDRYIDRRGKAVDRSLGKPPRCTWCLRGEEAGPVVEDLDGRRLHDECRAEVARRRFEAAADPVLAEARAVPAEAPPPPARGPLPAPSEGRAHRIHEACGGAGCPECSGTGYASMGRRAIEALEARLAAEAPAIPDRAPAIPDRAPAIPDRAPIILNRPRSLAEADRPRGEQLTLF